MKRKLLLFFAMLTVSIGAWAGPEDEPVTDPEHTYLIEQATGTSKGVGPVVVIHVQGAGGLQKALAKLSETNHEGETPAHLQKYQNSLILKIDSKSFTVTDNGAGNPPTVTYGDYVDNVLSADDISALASTTQAQETLDLQDLKSSTAFTFANANVKRIILPDGWDKTAVRNAAQAIPASNSNFESCLSQTPAQSGADGGLVAYVKKPGTLYTAMHHTYYDGDAHVSQKIGQAGQYNTTFNKIATISIMGYPSARDFNGNANTDAVKFDENGHFVFNVPADETKVDANAGIGGVTRVLLGTHYDGALVGASPVVLDLEDAIIYDQWNEDLNLSWSYLLTKDRIKRVIIPTTPELKTIPADFLNAGGNVNYIDEICIPGNIQYIKTRAFYSSQQMLKHVWTTGTTDHMVYDNGAYLRSTRDQFDEDGNFNVDHYGYADLNSEVWNCGKSAQDAPRYGTITLPENLKLIESNCFSCRSVSDVYVLAKVAPECHVDAFSSIMYMGNNTIDPNGAASGMITRWSYAQGDATAEYITFLHYPRECGTPEIQRYTDPTRDYSVATTWRDGKGNIVYFPNQSELNRAYYQGTTGYVWYAWDSERIPDNGNNGDANAFKNVNINGTPGHSTANQQMGNTYYNNNTMTSPDKTDRSFYDVRLDANDEPTLGQPAGLKWYYNTIWEGQQLYPKPETVGVVDEQGNPVMETVPVRDANGNIIYDEAASGATYEGNYIRSEEDIYTKDAEGEYCHQLVPNDQGQYTIGYSYTESETGGWVKASYNNQIYIQWQDYMASDPAYMNAKRYDREISGFIKFTDQWGAPRFNISDDYVLYETYDSEYKQYLDRFNKTIGYVYTEATSSDAGPFYTMRTEQAQAQNVVAKRDYRGWHQFILNAYATNDDRPITPVKFYQTDNDWWTVCLPYDLKYSDMIRFFGDGEGKKPYLSKLRYVVRDYDKEKITLMFSKNLMEYKEVITNPSITDDYVHGVIDDEMKYNDTELAADPIVLHKGVPYLIRPNIPANANRQFDVYKRDHENANPDLYQRLVDSQNVPAAQLETYIYKGEYTVPAYVIGDNAPEATVDSREFEHALGPKFTYNSSDQIMYDGKKVSARISNEFSYTFVGSFFLSILPKYCYFLGWDSDNNRAAFWYNKLGKKDEYAWNNQTGVICANFDTSTLIDPATGLNDPAKWYIPEVANDDLKGTSATGNAKVYGMDCGGSVDVVVSGIGKINADNIINDSKSADVIFNMQGVRMNQPLNRLPKGVYIMNGKKFVVK